MSTDRIRLNLLAEKQVFLDRAQYACRRALLDVMSKEAAAWSKRELAAWLAGPYRDATRYAPQSVDRSEGPPSLLLDGPLQLAGSGPSELITCGHARLEQVLHEARERVLAIVVAAPASDGSFAFAALEMGAVQQLDHDVGHAFSPVDRPRMRLFERMVSLLAADFLGRPADYESKLTICRVCTCLSFSEELREVGLCEAHLPTSHRAPKEAGADGSGRYSTIFPNGSVYRAVGRLR
jgi:hypothetical protein